MNRVALAGRPADTSRAMVAETSVNGVEVVLHAFGALYLPAIAPLSSPICISKRARPMRGAAICCRPGTRWRPSRSSRRWSIASIPRWSSRSATISTTGRARR